MKRNTNQILLVFSACSAINTRLPLFVQATHVTIAAHNFREHPILLATLDVQSSHDHNYHSMLNMLIEKIMLCCDLD